MLTVATLEPSYVATSEHFAGIRVETSEVPVDRYGSPSKDPDSPYRLFQTFTETETRQFRDVVHAMGLAALALI